MERTDYIETREDIISNIKTLYSYLHGDSGEDYKSWAIEKLRLGKNMVIEIIDGHVCFGPSRFVGYLSNTKENMMIFQEMALILIIKSNGSTKKLPTKDLIP